MPEHAERFFAITGPEGAGKTTLAGTLAKRGLPVIAESTRDIWRYQVRIGGPNVAFLGGTPTQKLTYFEMSLALDMRVYDEAAYTQGPVIFDRAMPDIIGFMEFFHVPVPEHIDRAMRLHRYNSIVFLAPFWPDIYVHDPERLSTPEEAASQEKICRDVYTRYGYTIITLPRVSPEERADFVLEHIRIDQTTRSVMQKLGY